MSNMIHVNADVSCAFCGTTIMLYVATNDTSIMVAHSVPGTDLIICRECAKAHRLTTLTKPVFGICYGTTLGGSVLEITDLAMGPLPTCPECHDTAVWCRDFRNGGEFPAKYNPDADMVIDTPECSE